MELCHKLPNTNVDDVTNALSLASKRLISNAYLRGGMGDGGGCHPRDNIALSWLARKLDVSIDFFEHIMLQREKQTEWFVSLIEENLFNDKIYILGKSFKPETNITTGSPAILLYNLLREKKHLPIHYDPFLDKKKINFEKGTYFIATKHDIFEKINFPKGSVVIDPFRIIDKDLKNVKVISIGNNID